MPYGVSEPFSSEIETVLRDMGMLRDAQSGLDSSRLRSGLLPHLWGLSLECPGASAAKR